ncbi:MAG: MBL fold metallo-hydrolase [Flavobacteriaceae bacterium]|nr:MBL fold metallo-hydrolase [Flavobacteriaceae bacterium]
MKLTFLGTGTSQGVPVVGSRHPVCMSTDPKDKRLRVSVLMEWDGCAYVVDCGPDFRQQMLRCGCDKIDGILFTHEHADHVNGLDDIRPFFFRQGDIPVYLHKRVLKSLKKRFDYMFMTANRYPGVAAVQPHFIKKNESFLLHGKEVIPINVYHNKLQVFGFRIDDLVYLTDVKTISKKQTEKVRGAKVLVVNALRVEPHATHFNLEEALEFIEKARPEKAYLTHISHLMGFHEEVQKTLPENVFLAYDGLVLDI